MSRTGWPLSRIARSLADAGHAEARSLDAAERAAVALAGNAALLVIEDAAGAGKTTTLAATRALLAQRGHRMVVVTPTRKAAAVAGRETGAGAFSAAWFAHQHGWRWDDNGRGRARPSTPGPAAVLRPGDLLVVDEAGMLDQDTARALLTIADETVARDRGLRLRGTLRGLANLLDRVCAGQTG